MSSLVQEIGLMPMRTSNISGPLDPLAMLVFGARRAHLAGLRNLRNADFPPPSPRRCRAQRIGVDHDDRGPIGGPCTDERRLELRDRIDMLSERAERACVRCVVDVGRAER